MYNLKHTFIDFDKCIHLCVCQAFMKIWNIHGCKFTLLTVRKRISYSSVCLITSDHTVGAQPIPFNLLLNVTWILERRQIFPTIVALTD